MARNEIGERYLITGASGQLGHALTKLWSGEEGVVSKALAKPRETLDVTNSEQVRDIIGALRPAAVVHCAAYTNTRLAEQEIVKCWQTNVQGTYYVASVCASLGIPLFYISTDYLYGLSIAKTVCSDKRFAEGDAYCFDEECPVFPLGQYANSKAVAEGILFRQAAADPDFQYWIVRTAGLFERPWRKSHNFLYQIASRLLESPQPVAVVADVTTNICSAEELALAINWMIEQRGDWGEDPCPSGVYHVANRGATTWFEVARHLAAGLGVDSNRVVATTLQDYRRSRGDRIPFSPRSSALCCDKYEALKSPRLTNWRGAVTNWCEQARGYF